MTAFETDLLAERIHRKLDCLLQLRDLSEKQLEWVQADRITDLLDVLSAKQRLLVELQRIERTLDPFRGQDPDGRQWRTPQARQTCAQQLQQSETLLGQIMTLEKQSERELIRRRDEVAARLQGVHLAGQARGAYTAQSPPYIRQLDLLSES